MTLPSASMRLRGYYTTFCADCRLVGSDLLTCHRFWSDYGQAGSYPPRREKANSGKELIFLVVWKGEFPTHNPTHSTRPLVRFSATYAAFGSPRSLVSCCKTYNRAAVTAEVASSSLVVPAISSAKILGAFEATARRSARESSVQLDHGLTTGTKRSSKCDVLRVASFACEASTMPAIIVSRSSPGRPCL